MPKIIALVVALGFVIGALLWAMSPTVRGTPTAQSISIQELHAVAHLDALPIDDFDDMSVVYTAANNK
jgi:hypothetical protein